MWCGTAAARRPQATKDKGIQKVFMQLDVEDKKRDSEELREECIFDIE